MRTWQIIIGVLLFAAAAAILYIWGLKKSVGQQEDMMRALLSACGSRVMKYLKKHDTISKAEIARQIAGVTIRPVWSRNRMKVQDAKAFTPKIIEFLLDQQYIQEAGHNTYRRKL